MSTCHECKAHWAAACSPSAVDLGSGADSSDTIPKVWSLPPRHGTAPAQCGGRDTPPVLWEELLVSRWEGRGIASRGVPQSQDQPSDGAMLRCGGTWVLREVVRSALYGAKYALKRLLMTFRPLSGPWLTSVQISLRGSGCHLAPVLLQASSEHRSLQPACSGMADSLGRFMPRPCLPGPAEAPFPECTRLQGILCRVRGTILCSDITTK